MQTERPQSNRWLILVIACLAQFMVVLDSTIVNVALPSIQRGLHFSPTSLQWVVNGYTLMFGGFLMLGGRAADLVGRRRLFVVGVALFSLASLVNGLAQSPTMLIVGRGVQGLGAALVSPAALSIIMTSFQDHGERTKALGIWSGIAAGGAAFGLLLGGILTDLVSWHWIFFVNVPVGVLAIALALRSIPESRADLGHRSFDLAGAVTVTGGLITLVFGIVKAETWGWGSARVLGILAAAVVLLGVFVFVESRSSAPLVRLSVFRIRSIATANTVMLFVMSGMFGMFYFISLYVQDILGYSPLRAGFAFLPVTLGIIVGATLAQQLIARIGVRNVAIAGIALATAGLFLLKGVPIHGSYVSNLLVGLVPMAIGMGLTFVPITLLGTSGVSTDDSGLASGLFNTSQQVGGSLGLAILATLAADHSKPLIRALGPRATHAQVASATLSGYHVAFLTAAIMMAIGAVIMPLFLRRRHVDELAIDPSAIPVPA